MKQFYESELTDFNPAKDTEDSFQEDSQRNIVKRKTANLAGGTGTSAGSEKWRRDMKRDPLEKAKEVRFDF